MAVKGKGKQVATEPPRAPGSGSGTKRRKGAGDAGPSSSPAAAKRRRREGVLQFVDDVAGVADEYEEEEEAEEEPGDEDDLDDGFFTEGRTETANLKRTERSHPLPFLGKVKEEELSGDELEEFVKYRYSNNVKHAGYGGSNQGYDDDYSMDDVKEPTIWRVKCMVGRERQMAFCFMQKFVDLKKFGTKVPIISAFALDHVRGFVFVEAEKACDVTEACKGFCTVYASRISSVPASEIPSLLSTHAKPFEISPGTWVRLKNGNYKGDLAQVASADDGRKRVMIKLIPRVDLQAISKKFGGAISLKEAVVPPPRLISSQELEFFRPHIEMRRDRQTGDVFEVLDGLMFKDGFLYKRVSLSSLIYWGIQPTETELLKFSSSPSNKSSADDLDWVSGIYGSKKRNLPRERDMKPSSSKEKRSSSKASNLKASTSTENYDDDNDEFKLHDLVLFGRKDFGVVIAVEKDGFKVLKGGPEGSAVTVRKQDIKKSCVDKMFTAVDHQKKIISINDTVKVLEGPFQDKQGVVKHLYMGILFIYNESESDSNGFFCAQCGSCENIKKRKELGSSAENLENNPIPMFSESYGQNEQQDTERSYRSTREQLFSIGQMLRIRKGPLKGYLCRVVRIFRNDITVKLDSLLKIVTVQAELLSVPANRGDNSSSAPFGTFGNQEASLFGSETGKSSWDNGLPSFGSDSWQPFSSSSLPVQNADGESVVDPWCKKTSAAEGDSDPWGKETSLGVEVWNNSTTQKESSSDNAWDKQTGGGGSDVGGSSWDRAGVNKESEKNDNWGDACKVADMGTGGDSDPWGSKVKEVDVKETDSWGWVAVPPEKKLENDSQVWGQPGDKSNQDQERDLNLKDADKTGAWDTAVANCIRSSSSAPGGGDDDAWVKSDVLPVAQDDAWGKSKENNGDAAVGWNKTETNQSCSTGGWDTTAGGKGKDPADKFEGRNNESGSWNKAGGSDQGGGRSDWDKPKFSGGDGLSSWHKGEVGEDNQNNSWSRPGGNFEGGRGFGRGRGRGRGQDSGDFGDRNDQGNWKSSWGSDNSGRPSWRSDGQVDNEAGDSGGYRGRGRGRGQYGGGGRGRDNSWKNGNGGGSDFGKERSSGNTPNWDKDASNKGSWGSGDDWNAPNPSSRQPWSSSEGAKSHDENQTSNWNSSEDKKPSGGEQNDPWASKITSTKGEQNDPWASKITSTKGAKDNNDGWNTKAKDSSFSTGGKEQETDPWACKVTSTAGADDDNNGWNTKATDAYSKDAKWGSAVSNSSGAEKNADAWNSKGGNGNGGGWNNAGSSGGHQGSWGKPNFSIGDQEPAWNKPKYGDDNAEYGRGGFGRGNRGRGRGSNFGDGGSSWGRGSNRNDESGGERSDDRWNRRDFDGGRGRGRGRFGRGDRNQGNNFGSGDRDGSSWGSGRGNGDRDGGYRSWKGNGSSWDKPGGGWNNKEDGDQAGKNDGNSTWNQNKPSFGGGSSVLGQCGASSGDATSSWGGSVGGGGGSSWDKPGGGWNSNKSGDDQAGKNDGNNTWNQNKSSVLGQCGASAGDATSSWGGSVGGEGGSSWEKPGGGWNGNTSGDDQAGKNDGNNTWNQKNSSVLGQCGASAGDATSLRGGSAAGGWSGSDTTMEKPSWGGSETGSKKEGSWGKAEGTGSQGGAGRGSSWDKADGGWNSNEGGGARW